MIVLDEADRLVELGQEEDVQAILKAIQDAKKNEGKEEKKKDADADEEGMESHTVKSD
jgi:superfamily II DNA/RNA helicase